MRAAAGRFWLDMSAFTDLEIEYMAGQRLGRIATVGADGQPHVVPTSFRYNADEDAIDVAGMRMSQTKKTRDVRHAGRASIVIDDVLPPWQPRMIEVRGTAAARASRGPVYVFNPQRLAPAPSTMRWDVLSGCADPATAIRRAQPLSAMAAFKGEGEDFWAAATELWLQTLLHVAALRRSTIDLVHYWALEIPRGSSCGPCPGRAGKPSGGAR